MNMRSQMNCSANPQFSHCQKQSERFAVQNIGTVLCLKAVGRQNIRQYSETKIVLKRKHGISGENVRLFFLSA